ncbi:MAG: hypothetical protein ACK4YP_17600 [Myxococcota bacterium]
MIFALTLLGCATWIDQEPACDQDVYHWSDDLLAYVLTGDGSGEFSLDPADEPRTSVEGGYDPTDGEFSWTEDYDPGFYLETAEVDGFGTVFHNGNLDLLYTRSVRDMLDDVYDTVFRVQRTGCDMTIATWGADGSVDDAFVMEGSYKQSEVFEWEADFPGYAWRGSMRDTLLRTQQIEADDGSYWSFTTTKPSGESTEEWTGVCGDYYCEGQSVRNFDGTRDESYEAYDGDELVATITGEFEYDGSGEQVIAYVGGPECVFSYDADGDCSYECDDDTDGSC